MDNKYSKTSWKNKKEQKTYPHGKRMSAQKGGLISDYFDKWIEYVKVCKHCDFKILPDDWDFQKVKTEVRCDRCGYISHFPNGKVNAKNSTPFNFGYEDQLKNKKTNKISDISTILILIIFVISFIIGQTQTLEKPAQSVETGLTLPIQQKIKIQNDKTTIPAASQKSHTPINPLENKPIINNIASTEFT